MQLGQHMVVATSQDGADQVKQLSEVKSTGQTLVTIELQPVAARSSGKEWLDGGWGLSGLLTRLGIFW